MPSCLCCQYSFSEAILHLRDMRRIPAAEHQHVGAFHRRAKIVHQRGNPCLARKLFAKL